MGRKNKDDILYDAARVSNYRGIVTNDILMNFIIPMNSFGLWCIAKTSNALYLSEIIKDSRKSLIFCGGKITSIIVCLDSLDSGILIPPQNAQNIQVFQ